MLINYFSPLLIIYYTRQKCHLSPKNKGFAISEITKHPTFMPFLPPLPHKCTSVCRKKINNYIHTRYLINYFFYTCFLYENMWQKWHRGRMHACP